MGAVLARWPAALLVACLTAAAGGALGLPVALWAMEILHASRFEGSSDFAVVFLWTPLAMITGLIVGLIVGFSVGGTGFAGFAAREGIALAIMVVLITVAGGIVYAYADHPPRVDGKRIEVEFELRVPTRGRSVEEVKQPNPNAPFAIRFMAGDSFTSYARENWGEARRTEEFITVPVRGILQSQDAKREFTAGMSGESWQVFRVPLPPSPDKVEEAWSEWLSPYRRWGGEALAPEDKYGLRYRVRFAGE